MTENAASDAFANALMGCGCVLVVAVLLVGLAALGWLVAMHLRVEWVS